MPFPFLEDLPNAGIKPASPALADGFFILKITDRILAEVKGVNRVVWDITPKPPSMIEWE